MGSGENFLDHGRRIAALERKVDELYKRLGQEQPEFGMRLDSETAASVTAADDPRLIELLQSGKKINAIKLYRELTGVGLAEAKNAVERIEQMYRPAPGG
jgi:ribosomal protein L7/L12